MNNISNLDEYKQKIADEDDDIPGLKEHLEELEEIDFEAVTKDILGIKENELIDNYNRNERQRLNSLMAEVAKNLDRNVAFLKSEGKFHF